MQRESMAFDALIIGGGPAGLAAAIRLKQCALAQGTDLSVCLIDKGSEIGAHILSGAVMDPRALNELLPDWRNTGAPPHTPVSADELLFLSSTRAHKIPAALVPQSLHNAGHYILSLGQLCRWLASQAEALGVDIYPGFAATEILYDAQGRVIGVATGDMGRLRDGTPGPAYQPGMELHAHYTLFAEGCRGQLGQQLETRFNLRAQRDPQSHALGIKEVWEISPEKFQPGRVQHTIGWPLQPDTYGGGFLYHYGERHLAVGYIIGLDYSNPHLSLFEEFQRFKTHPALRDTFTGAKRLSYGARALSAGGLQALPHTIFPGGALIGDDAGFLNAARLKGTHTAIKSGMLAAEAAAQALFNQRAHDELTAYPLAVQHSWLQQELHAARNFKPAMSRGLYTGGLLWGLEQLIFRGHAPWTLHKSTPDHLSLKPAAQCAPIHYPKPDGQISFDRLSSVFLSNTHHSEDQPCHLQLHQPDLAITHNLALYDAPEQRYCPAGVYEILRNEHGPRLQINAQNCLHCKSCDIKDPRQNITWLAPQGGEGPLYTAM